MLALVGGGLIYTPPPSLELYMYNNPLTEIKCREIP